MRSSFLIFVLCAFPALGTAQDRTAVSGPVAGFVFDQKAQALRPMLGIPGAAYLGPAVAAQLEAVAVAPGGETALAVKQGRLYLVTGLKSEAAAAAIDGAIESVDRIAWAPGGGSAAVYSSASRRGQVLRKLASAPEAGEALDLSGLPGEVTALACAGDALAAGVAAESGGGVYLAAGAAPKLLAAAGRPVSLAVAGRDLYFADRERGEVWQIRDFSGDATPLLFAAGLDTPVGVQIAGNRLFVANAGSSTLEIFDLSARASAGSLPLDTAPAGLESFGARTVWLLNGAGAAGDPLYILDGGPSPSVYFVPAGREE